MRPARLVVVTGTATGVGKTWMAVALAEKLRGGGLSVTARKPVQSYGPARTHAGTDTAAGTDAHIGDHTDAGSDTHTDAEALAGATGEDAHEVCPAHRWYPLPMAPPMAADALGRAAFTVSDLLAEVAWPDPQASVGLVETVGGPRSPVAADGDSVDLAAGLCPDLALLVADAGLGAVNAVRLSMAALAAVAAPVVVVLNRFDSGDDLHLRNLAWLTADGLDVTVEMSHLAGRLA